LDPSVPPAVQAPPPPTAAPFPSPKPPSWGISVSVGRTIAAVLVLVAGILAAVSTFVSWWTISESGGPGGTLSFLPGGNLQAIGSGSTESISYASVQLGPVGALYEAVLALAIVIACLALIVGVLLLLAAMGKIQNPARYTTLRNLILVALVVSLFLIVIVPSLQGTLIRHSGSTGTSICTLTGNSTNPCNDFWGSSGSYTWGADAGWYLALSATVLLAVALFLWRSARAAPWGSSAPAGPGAAPGAFPSMPAAGPATPADRLLQAKRLADAGLITPAEYTEVKGRLLGQVSAADLAPGVASRPEDELTKLKSLHDTGAISDEEYADLRRKALLRF